MVLHEQAAKTGDSSTEAGPAAVESLLDDSLVCVRAHRLGGVHLVDVGERHCMSAADICDLFAVLVMAGVIGPILWGMVR